MKFGMPIVAPNKKAPSMAIVKTENKFDFFILSDQKESKIWLVDCNSIVTFQAGLWWSAFVILHHHMALKYWSTKFSTGLRLDEELWRTSKKKLTLCEKCVIDTLELDETPSEVAL